MKPKNALVYLGVRWKTLVIVTVPLVFIPIAMMEGQAAKCGYILAVMAVYWVTEALPLPITSLIPIVALPVFDLMSTNEVCMLYFKETNVMFMGGIIVAIAVEYCNLHRRIALRVLLCVGTSPRRLLFGFMLTTMFLSMWISNSAATAMMVPIVSGVLLELTKLEKVTEEVARGSEKRDEPLQTKQPEEAPPEAEGGRKASEQPPSVKSEAKHKSFAEMLEERGMPRPTPEQIAYFLGIAYAANIGGTGTITGTTTNLVFKGLAESIFKDAEGVNFASWMEFNVPLMLLNTFFAWLWLQLVFMNPCQGRKTRMKLTKEQKARIFQVIQQNYKDLGPISFHEVCVLILFIMDISLWFFRKPEFITGWSSLFPGKPVQDATPAIAVVILLFLLPANKNFLNCDPRLPMRSPPLLTWKVLEEKLPFGIILLLGSGYAISKACEVSGLSNLMGDKMQAVAPFPRFAILAVVLAAATFATEFCSNTAMANILLPVLARMCRTLRIHPFYLMMPTTVACSFAFMLPVATPPNAIVVTASNMRSIEMIKAGLGMNIICMMSLLVTFHYIGVPMYHLENFPKWAELDTNSTR